MTKYGGKRPAQAVLSACEYRFYMGNGRETTKFTLNVPMDGVYSIVVEGQRAKGRIRIDLDKATELTADKLAGPWHG